MRQDQLEQARRTRWRQDGNALLTLDDAERWLAETPLCLYLPRRQHLPVPAPSFVEAIAGRPDPTPGPEQIAAAAQMLARLVASGAVIALNLFGAAPGIGVSSFVGEHPDFLATPEALPYLYALQPERNPKREPTTAGNGRVSPLAAEAWKLLEREGALTTMELRSKLGREVTEAAVLRSLAELWHTMRVVPVPAENPQEGAHWELLSARHRRELNIGSTQSQTTALSILVSFYLQSAVSATAEEVEIFLSPVASRSRLRDVVHGLSTTRQLASFSLAGDEQFYVEGTLPEIAEEEETVVLAASTADAASLDAGLEQNEPSLIEAAATGAAPDRARPAAPRRPSRPAFADRARGSFAARDRRAPSGDRAPRREGGFRRPQRSGDRPSGAAPFRRAEGAEGTAAEGTARPQRPNFERRARPSFGRPDRPDRSAGSGSAAGPRTAGPSMDRPRTDRPDSGRPARSGGFARPGSAGKRFGSSPRPSSGRFERGGPTRGAFNKPGGFSKPGSFGKPRTFSNSRGSFDRGGSFDKDRPARPTGGSFRRDKPAGDYPPRTAPRTGEGAERPRFRPAGGPGSPRFGQNRPGRPPARAGERPFRAGATGTGEGRSSFRPDRTSGPGGSSRPDRPFRKPFGDRPAAGPRRFDSRPPRRDGPSRPQGDRPFKRPYSPTGARPPRPAPRPASRPAATDGAPPSSGADRPERTFTPRPRPEGARSRPEGGERGARPFRAGGQRPGGFSKSAGRPGSFSKPGFAKPGYRKPAAGEAGTGKPRFDRPKFGRPRSDRPQFDRSKSDRPRAPRPALGSGERSASGPDAAPAARKPGGFRKPAGPGKSFGKPRPAGASYGKSRPAGAGKGRTSTTTSSGKPRRPGGFDKPRPGGAGKPRTGGKPGGRPPAKGGKPGGLKAGAKRPGGIAAPKRKPRGEGDEG
jgi:23S rRNA pseudouridine2605 synthase